MSTIESVRSFFQQFFNVVGSLMFSNYPSDNNLAHNDKPDEEDVLIDKIFKTCVGRSFVSIGFDTAYVLLAFTIVLASLNRFGFYSLFPECVWNSLTFLYPCWLLLNTNWPFIYSEGFLPSYHILKWILKFFAAFQEPSIGDEI